SLIATRLIAKLQLELGRALSIRDVFEQPILGVLAETLRNASCSDTPLLTAGMRPDPPPASFAQARLWLVEQIDGAMCRYVIPLTLRLDGRLDNAALWAALDDVVARHESLRTLLKTGADGTPLQEIVAATEAHVERVVEVVTRDELDEPLSVYASRPFHLDREFPLRVVLLSLEDADEEQVLLL